MSLEDENHKWVYTYGAGKAEGDRTMRNLLGGVFHRSSSPTRFYHYH